MRLYGFLYEKAEMEVTLRSQFASVRGFSLLWVHVWNKNIHDIHNPKNWEILLLWLITYTKHYSNTNCQFGPILKSSYNKHSYSFTVYKITLKA